MSTESLTRTSEVIENPSQSVNINNVVKLDVLKQGTDTADVPSKVRQIPKRVNKTNRKKFVHPLSFFWQKSRTIFISYRVMYIYCFMTNIIIP